MNSCNNLFPVFDFKPKNFLSFSGTEADRPQNPIVPKKDKKALHLSLENLKNRLPPTPVPNRDRKPVIMVEDSDDPTFDIMNHIFKFFFEGVRTWRDVKPFALACKTYCKVATQNTFVSEFLKRGPAKDLGLSAKVATHLAVDYCSKSHGLSLDLTGCDDLTDSHLERLASNPSITTLKVGGKDTYLKISKEAILNLASKCPRLEAIEFSKCGEIDDDCMQMFTANCPHLNSVTLYDCPKITDKTLDALTVCENLQTIDFMNLNIKDFGFSVLILKPDSKLANISFIECPGITSFSLATAAVKLNRNLKKLICIDCGSINDHVLAMLGQYCPNLTKLQLIALNSGCLKITDDGIEKCAAGCTKLLSLRIINASSAFEIFTDRSILALTNCTSLKNLGLAPLQVSAEALEALASRCQCLKTLIFPNSLLRDHELNSMARFLAHA